MSKAGLKYLKEKELKEVRKEIKQELKESQEALISSKALTMCKEFVTQFENTLEDFFEVEYKANKSKRQFADAIKGKLMNGCKEWKDDVNKLGGGV